MYFTPIRRRQHLQKMARPALLHLDGNCAYIQGAGLEKSLRDIGEILRRHVVDVGFDDDDRVYRGRFMQPRLLFAFAAHHQPQTVRKVLKLLCSGSITNLIDGDAFKQSEFVNNGRENRCARRRHEFRRRMLRINRRIAEEDRRLQEQGPDRCHAGNG